MKWQIFGVAGATVLATTGLGIIMVSTDPTVVSPLVKILFFVVSGVVLWGIASLLICFYHYRFSKKFNPEVSFYQALTYGLVASAVCVVVLLAKHFMV